MAASVLLLHPTTPPTYHRIISPTLQISTDPTTSIPVGLLACQRDPLLRELSTTVVSSRISQPTSVPQNNKKKKSAQPTPPSESLLEVLLHDTILFPEGGGQPSDIGLITTPGGETWEVVEVKRFGGHAVHFVKTQSGPGDIETALNSFRAGEKVLVQLGEEGFKRRLDHMCMHTSQHLLSALLETHLSLPTLSWSLTTYPSPSYVEIPRPLTPAETTLIQDLANRLVFEGRSVHIEVEEMHSGNKPGTELVQIGEGEGVKKRSVGKGVPEDYTGGVKRVVVIDGVDRNPCCGTHLPTLHNLQLFILPTYETVTRTSTSPSTSPSTPTTTTARISFLSGPRLLTHLSTTHSLLTSTSSILSCGPPLVPERTEQIVEERRRATKRVGELKNELADLVAGGLVSEIGTKREGEDGLVVVRKHRIDDNASNPLFLLQSISTSVINSTSASNPTLKYLIVLSSTTSLQSANSMTTILVFGSEEGAVKGVGERLRARLGVKGGGKGIRWSGKFTGVWMEEREGNVLEEVVEEVRTTGN
ncbi:hypothetical protein JAAARDRAFT_27889 [Jaapia argillacea MUCL 33604]|uniref:Threonyl/alanyl tRNA synthetase SAD domain-containing protein n=1 Tax=Jaapia argillacea MUCL 33604 TaxID=933084 RepID=A0A067QL66_9AGAM|nr:hypothetical protein JAAARDRAFT_27889 [Jaapia argillacea MUCL 33604]